MNSETNPVRLFAQIVRALAAITLLWSPAVSATAQDDEPLPPAAEVFKYDTRLQGDQVLVTYHIAADHYLYRSRLSFATTTAGVTLGPPQFPSGKSH